MNRYELFALVASELDAAKRRIIREYDAHALNCPDPVGCEVRAWQEFYAAQREETLRKRRIIASID